MQKEIRSIVKSVSKDIRTAWNAVTDIEEASRYSTSGEENPLLDANYNYLSFVNRGIYIKLCLALRMVGAVDLLEDLRKEFKSWKTLNEVDMPHWAESLSCPVTTVLSQYADALGSTVETSKDTSDIVHPVELTRLEGVLLGTPKLIADSGVEPQSEKEVREKVYNTLIHFYPDTVREIPIAKVSKTYKPDIGVRSLRAAIEYKFADSAEELKKAIGGVYEDILGYAGSKDWTMFYAVFYTTDAFLTPAQLNEEFKLAGAPHNWKPILVTGKGGRKKTEVAKKTSAKKKAKGP